MAGISKLIDAYISGTGWAGAFNANAKHEAEGIDRIGRAKRRGVGDGTGHIWGMENGKWKMENGVW
jgi:hypothetical protein